MVKMSEREVIIKTALVSRLLLILLQYIANFIIPDHKADAFCYPKSGESGFIDELVIHLLGGFVRWDAQHFMHISRYGYTYEHSLAFFPFCPILVRYVVAFLSYFIPFLALDSLTLVVFVSINILSFILSAICLYELSIFILNKDIAYKATILFCYNPASVFFTAPYTESIFSYLTFKSMLNSILLYKKYCDLHCNLQIKDVVYIIPICLSTLTRSNGVLNIGFLVYVLICLYLKKVKSNENTFDTLLCSIKFIVLTSFLVFFCMIPFISFQMYAFKMFCTDFETNLPDFVLKQAKLENFVLPGTFSKHNQTWCFKQIPLAYSHVQSHYWKVGFLQYYELKQIPNFALAFPLVFIIVSNVLEFFEHFPKRFEMLFNFNLISQKDFRSNKFNPLMLVFIIHATALTVFCVFNIHVQVTTRMLCSASPVLYWFSVYYVSDLHEGIAFKKIFSGDCCTKEYFILVYFISYFVIGTIMFCNFLPWT